MGTVLSCPLDWINIYRSIYPAHSILKPFFAKCLGWTMMRREMNHFNFEDERRRCAVLFLDFSDRISRPEGRAKLEMVTSYPGNSWSSYSSFCLFTIHFII